MKNDVWKTLATIAISFLIGGGAAGAIAHSQYTNLREEMETRIERLRSERQVVETTLISKVDLMYKQLNDTREELVALRTIIEERIPRPR